MAHSLRQWNCKVQSEGFSAHFLYAMFLNHVKESFYPYRENQILLKPPLDEEGGEIQRS